MKTEPGKFGEIRLRTRAAGTRKRLKEAALDIFSGKSVYAVTVEEITEKAGFVFGFFSFAMIGMTKRNLNKYQTSDADFRKESGSVSRAIVFGEKSVV